jgi:uncharacterized membrane protein
MKLRFYESLKRSVVKALTFRSVILISDAIIVYAITKRFDFTLGVMVFSNIASTLLYFAHERAWAGVAWGNEKATKA